MSAEGFGYMPLGIHPPVALQIPPQSTFNPSAATFIPASGSQLQRRSASPQVLTIPRRQGPLTNVLFRPDISRSPTPGDASMPRDTRSKPSAASGGVPNPSPTYLAHASLPPLLLPYPRKILVVIDLNGTLLYRPNRKNPSSFIERPHARRFLSYCIETFVVAIWSSAKPDNVRKMCDQLMTPTQQKKVVAIWGRDKFGLSRSDYKQRVQCYKRLSALWSAPEVARSHPNYANGSRWGQADTVLVDDSLEKARSEPYNLIPIPEFMGDRNEPGYILPQVHDYINECSLQANISTYIRVSPFQSRANFVLGNPGA
ncbi:hypothetical protein DL770_007263 [Monosporascus sp. CRB-9-2]|nr:hypothetical protein DL770_007263 [Monosporascus sp. CRB-9-2]